MLRTCITIGREFEVTPAEQSICERLGMPLPVEHPDVRLQKQLAFRNEWGMYKRICDGTGKEIVSLVHPDRDRKVYGVDYWYSDHWDPMNYGMEYDPSRSFLDQITELARRVPIPAIVQFDSHNSNYSSWGGAIRNCYLCSCVSYTENCCYCYFTHESRSCIDSTEVHKGELAHTCIYGENIFNVRFAVLVDDCRDSAFLFDCKDCSDCFWCVGLRHKQYCIRNVEYSKEEYEAQLTEELAQAPLTMDTFDRFYQWSLRHPRHCNANMDSENSTGTRLYNCKDCTACYNTAEGENVTHGFGTLKVRDSMDVSFMGFDCELLYNSISGEETTWSGCNFFTMKSSRLWYSMYCLNSQDLFGCIGLRNKRFCILNKGYSEEDYEALRARIITDMQARGEWGRFLPPEASPFFYNETKAQELFPLTESSAGTFPWIHWFPQLEYKGEGYTPQKDSKVYAQEAAAKELLSSVLVCPVSKKPFKIVGQELALYLQMNAPIPLHHPMTRLAERHKYLLPYGLHARSCMNPTRHDTGAPCSNSFETPYGFERPEKVFCEDCYQHTVS